MLILRDPAQLAEVTQPDIKALLQQRFHNICDPEPYDWERHGYFVVLQSGDTAESVEQAVGINLLGSLFSDEAYGDPGYMPDFEFLLNHNDEFYEAVYIANDSGYAQVFIIPKQGADERILRLCEEFAEFG